MKIDGTPEDGVSGTRWTAPGEGATAGELVRAAQLARPLLKEYRYPTPRGWKARTNLALTGAPLTAEDVQRIAEAK
jgi:hypothetical protein